MAVAPRLLVLFIAIAVILMACTSGHLLTLEEDIAEAEAAKADQNGKDSSASDTSYVTKKYIKMSPIDSYRSREINEKLAHYPDPFF